MDSAIETCLLETILILVLGIISDSLQFGRDFYLVKVQINQQDCYLQGEQKENHSRIYTSRQSEKA